MSEAATTKRPVVTIEPAALSKEMALIFLGGISESTFDRLVRAKKLPRPRLISSGAARYRVADLRAYLDSCPESDLLPPEGAGHGRAGKPQ